MSYPRINIDENTLIRLKIFAVKKKITMKGALNKILIMYLDRQDEKERMEKEDVE